LDQGILIRVRGKTGWREVEIGRGSSDPTCPVVALQTWLKLGRIAHGPLFRRIVRGGKESGPDRLTDKHVARLVKRTALSAAVAQPAQIMGEGGDHTQEIVGENCLLLVWRPGAILLIGFAGGLRRSEITGLDCGRTELRFWPAAGV
jgi:hypothetical protein